MEYSLEEELLYFKKMISKYEFLLAEYEDTQF
jgi:hypothetical protein